MPRSLRSGSRRKKLQVQQIQQVNKKLRVSINNCIESNIADFNQIEFLSLFGLTQIVQSNSQKSKCNGCITRSPPNHTTDENIGKDSLEGTFSMNNVSHTGSSAIDYNDAFKIRYALECDLKQDQHIQKTLLAKKRSLLHDMRDAVADQRKCDLLFEEEKRMNFILKISINELLSKMLFLRERENAVTE